MSPIHHHFQKAGYHESKIVSRMWIIGIFLSSLDNTNIKNKIDEEYNDSWCW